MCKVPYQNILLLSIIMIFKRTLQAIRLHRNMMLSVVHDFSQLKSISHLQIKSICFFRKWKQANGLHYLMNTTIACDQTVQISFS